MLQPCPHCGANVLHAEAHAEFHLVAQDLEERVAVLENRLSEIGSVMLSEAHG